MSRKEKAYDAKYIACCNRHAAQHHGEVSAIRVNRLSLAHFRNYAVLDMVLSPGVTLVTGENGQGKTNLLESVYVLATGHSHRAETDREIIGWTAAREPIPYARIAASVTSGEGAEQQLELVMQLARRGEPSAPALPQASADESLGPPGLLGGVLQKGFRVNGVRQRSAGALGRLAVVLAGPEEVDLFAGPPAIRRRFLDSAAIQTDAVYAQASQRYQRLVTQRNAGLRSARERGVTERTAEMRVWESELIRAGALILARRLAMLNVLQVEMVEAHDAFTGGNGPLSLDYRSTVPVDEADGVDEAAMQKRFSRALDASWRRDSATAVTSVGPHRDDLRAMTGDVDLGIYGSRGQQRTAALSLVLAQAAYMGRVLGDEPVIMLDDPLSELDAARRERVLRRCLSPGRQVLVTTAEPELIPADILAEASHHVVEAGTVKPAQISS